MNEPPDPGGTCPQDVACNVTLSESGMDTDGSLIGNSSRKRKVVRQTKICKHCNKKRKKRSSNGLVNGNSSDCNCEKDKSSIPNSSSEQIIDNSKNDSTPPSPPQVSRTIYESWDASPFVIHVQKKQSFLNDGTTLHPVTFGNFLKKHNFYNIINGSVKKIGRNRISLSFSNYLDANSFLTNELLIKNDYKAFIPSFNITRIGLVRGVPIEWSPDEIIDNINVPIGCGKILKARRLNFKKVIEGKVIWNPSQAVVLTFDGQILPKRIFMCYNALPVDLYTFPTIQCYNCCRFGHTKVQCRSKPQCYKCGHNHSAESCNVEEENVVCCSCRGNHFATNKSCPEFLRQKQIKLSMAQNCISYAEASKLHPASLRSYADVLTSTPTPSPSRPLTNNIHIQSSPTHHTQKSYKKTFISRPHNILQKQYSKEYDKVAHNNIIKDPHIQSPNGCAFTLKEDQPVSVSDLINMLISYLKTDKSSPSLPSNADILLNLLNEINNKINHNYGSNPQNNTMEL